MTAPSTAPPPSTRSSSPIPVETRADESAGTSDSATGPVPDGAERLAAPLPTMRSSTSVFQPPQPTQRPSHLMLVAPHAWQTNCVTAFAIALTYSSGLSARRAEELRQ